MLKITASPAGYIGGLIMPSNQQQTPPTNTGGSTPSSEWNLFSGNTVGSNNQVDSHIYWHFLGPEQNATEGGTQTNPSQEAGLSMDTNPLIFIAGGLVLLMGVLLWSRK